MREDADSLLFAGAVGTRDASGCPNCILPLLCHLDPITSGQKPSLHGCSHHDLMGSCDHAHRNTLYLIQSSLQLYKILLSTHFTEEKTET